MQTQSLSDLDSEMPPLNVRGRTRTTWFVSAQYLGQGSIALHSSCTAVQALQMTRRSCEWMKTASSTAASIGWPKASSDSSRPAG